MLCVKENLTLLFSSGIKCIVYLPFYLKKEIKNNQQGTLLFSKMKTT